MTSSQLHSYQACAMNMSPQLQLILVFGSLITFNTVNGSLGHLVYHVAYTGSHVEISVQHDTLYSSNNQLVPDLGHLGGTPVIHLSTCVPNTPSSISGLLPTAHTLHTTSQLTPSQLTVHPTTTLSIPSYLQGASCLEVAIEKLLLGAGLTVPPLRKQLLISSGVRNDSELFCSSGECVVVDSSWTDLSRASLVRHTLGGRYSLVYHIFNWVENSSIVSHPVPKCIAGGAAHGDVTWQRVESNTSCEQPFTPTHVYTASKRDVFIRGNGLLYSPNGGLHLYQLMGPNLTAEILSFAVSSVARVFAMVTSQNASSVAVWFGYLGDSVLHQLYPSSLLDHLLPSWGVELNLTSVSLVFDDSGTLYLVTNSTGFRLPLALLLSHTHTRQTYTPTPSRPHPLLHPHLHTLTHSTAHCPYEEVRMSAPICGLITRTIHHVERSGALRWVSDAESAETNCSRMGDYLPRQIFLGKWESYQFNAHFVINPAVSNPKKLLFTPLVSDPDTVKVSLSSSYSPLGNMVTFTVVVRERGALEGQWGPGAVAISSTLTMKIWGAGASCLDALSSSPITSDYIQTTVHVGCPPGMSLTFDPETSRSQFSQHCQSKTNVSCYYFNNNFQPVFKLVDSVTDVEVTYSGPYTLRALSGGVSLSEMTEFLPSQHVELSIWTPINSSKSGPTPVYYYGDNAIKWVCGTSSPCGEILPRHAQPTEYYLLLEASNLKAAENSTYCHLSVQFLIRIHGLGMGAVTTVVALIVFSVLLVLLLIAAFLCWLNRLKFIYWKDLLMESQGQRWDNAKLRVTEMVRRHKLNSHKNMVFM